MFSPNFPQAQAQPFHCRAASAHAAFVWLRQYSGTAGRIENCQVGVFLAYAGAKSHAPIDRALYLPQAWTDDRTRCRAAGVPGAVRFAPKPRLAERMFGRAWGQGVRVAWVTGDAVYAHDGKFRRLLEDHGQPYLQAVLGNQPLFDGTVRSRMPGIADELPAGAWPRSSAGDGAKGPRDYDWAIRAFGAVHERGWQLWLVVRRHRERPDERAYFFQHYAILGVSRGYPAVAAASYSRFASWLQSATR